MTGQHIYFLRSQARAGNGNRTRMASLEGWNFTIKLCPRALKLPCARKIAKSFLINSGRGANACTLAKSALSS